MAPLIDKRLELHDILVNLLPGVNIYFQPTENIQMSYPALVYERDRYDMKHADNRLWKFTNRYQLTIIDKDPDSAFLDNLLLLPMLVFERHFTSAKLNHDVYNLYF